MLGIPNIKSWTTRAKAILVCIGLLIILGSILSVKSCYENKQIEKTDSELQPYEANTANSQVDQWAKEQNAKDAATEVERAKQNTQKAKEQANVKVKEGVSIEEANKNRCQAYPQSKECR